MAYCSGVRHTGRLLAAVRLTRYRHDKLVRDKSESMQDHGWIERISHTTRRVLRQLKALVAPKAQRNQVVANSINGKTERKALCLERIPRVGTESSKINVHHLKAH